MKAIIKTIPLQMFWPTFDPFLFCAFHNDAYPAGNGKLGPNASLSGRQIGQDFSQKDGWSMYHGSEVPGFPAHPHRGFETVTVVNKGYVDHADSMGAAGRYGEGDTQWMTAGKGVQHSEMMPLVHTQKSNPLELFQIWLNLPSYNKMVEPHFSMLWKEDTPIATLRDENDKGIKIKVVAGSLNVDGSALQSLPCPPNSWANDKENHVAIWIIDLEVEASWTLPASVRDLSRTLYVFEGEQVQAEDSTVPVNVALQVKSDAPLAIKNTGSESVRILLLQGKPINENVEQHGPFVMNTRQELQQAFFDYQQTQFGGWRWPSSDQTHGETPRRFALYADGREETP
ncbi:pirin family protein [Marinomonas mediterranea]|uniref:pirin family protein n=1 Tax=Marinomonas mediterranea TaxID=119864 RepID=UPI0023490CE0|nr:pirin family protein [Marinomonas mediterranea]